MSCSPVQPGRALERWQAVLDELEAVIDRQRAAVGRAVAIDADAIGVLVFSPPDDLPRLPAELEGRVRQLLATTRSLAEEASVAADRIRPRASAGAQPPGRAASAVLDHRM